MRLFIALNFHHEVKAQIIHIINSFKANSLRGRFVSAEHLHLTLEFLGEVPPNKVNQLKGILNGLNFAPFTLNLTKAGYFKREEGNIYWLGIESNPALFRLQKALHQSLQEHGFTLENREYRPHITLGRKVVLNDSFNPAALNEIIGQIKIRIQSVELMKSENLNGQLKYSVIHSKELNE